MHKVLDRSETSLDDIKKSSSGRFGTLNLQPVKKDNNNSLLGQ